MRILVIGSGGREHALVWAMRRAARRQVELFCADGNAGIGETAQLVNIAPTNIKALADFAREQQIDLTVVGGEAALAAGIADEFIKRDLLIAAPTQAAARLESSKAFAKNFMLRQRIPTAHFRVVTSREAAQRCLSSGEFGDEQTPVVVKADGLAAGKGVYITKSHAEALRAVEELLKTSNGNAAVLLEETLIGKEASLLLWSDGKDYRLMPAARDHKRLGENDTGLNTGGMGAITSPEVLDAATLENVVKTIVEPTLAGAQAEGFPFRGILYVGLMLTPDGAKVLEYNTRFGDPEAQAILVRLNSDLTEIFESVARGNLHDAKVEWSEDASACVVLAARGYPNQPETGARINGLDKVARDEDVQVFHAATKRDGDAWLTAGGRVLGVTATARRLDDALAKCYAAVDKISWDGMIYRRDIGKFA